MFGIWIIIIISIITKKFPYLIIIIPLYTLYILIECYSNKNLFKEQKTPEDMKILIGNLFTSLPSIIFICEIYETKTRTDIEGNKENYDEYIGSEYKYLKILSSRDVSGVLNLDYEGYFYAYLQLEVEINFSDTVSYNDYINQKEEFKKLQKRKNNTYNQSIRFKEERDIKYIRTSKNYLVNIYNTQSCFLSRITFNLFTIFTIGPIYEIIFYFHVIFLKFKIRKIISTRYDLSNDSRYDSFTPKLLFPKERFVFNKQDISYLDNKNNIIPPTSEEIAQSMKYKDYIPEYKLYSGNNKNLIGSVINIKENNYNINQNYYYYRYNSWTIPVNIKVHQKIDNNNETNSSIHINQMYNNYFAKNN